MTSKDLKAAADRMTEINRMSEGEEKKNANRELVESLWNDAADMANEEYEPTGTEAAKIIRSFEL